MPMSESKGLTKETDKLVANVRQEPVAWSPATAYAVGLAATDGCLIERKSTINFKSCDRDLVQIFLGCVGLPNRRIYSVSGKKRITYWAQFGDSELYRWFLSAGLTPRKSLTLGALAVPVTYLPHCVRGLLDGDGSLDCYVHHPIVKVDPTYSYQRLG